ncbi:hypothetical protein NL64_17215 [Pseudomonas fluorescens]|jgi:hypothetical protein|uniref:DUF6124 family protein n=1 Tax=Pseudomonas fluorescens TaxID=294 RepID=UPI00054BA20D|nr:DUF6124 family protein [Pseudomonas fluorescens]KII30813.1 hypothetical protein NL64_17215 [Pseudomonas fluorescens]
MKKAIPIAPKPSGLPASGNVDLPNTPKSSEQLVTVRLRNHTRPEPASQFFAVIPDVDTQSLLSHTSETLASLSVMATDLARELEGPRRQVILTIQQLSALGELMVNRALDNLDSPRQSSETPSTSQR